MKKIKYPILILLIVLFIASCGSTTAITASYKEPNAKGDYKKVFITALTDNNAAKQNVENRISELLVSRGAATIKSVDVLPPNFRKVAESKDKNLVIQKIQEKGCDGIMTIALVNKENETRYVQGTSYYPAGVPYYGGFGAYYAYGYDNFYSPGYYTTDKIYYLEVNLYDATTEKLVWSAQSKTYNPESLDDFLNGYVKAIGEEMTKDGIIPPPAKK